MKLSIVIAVLDSHEVYRRQVLHYSRILKDFEGVELIFVDDGSKPKLPLYDAGYIYRIYATNNYGRWTQPAARNFGAVNSKGSYILFTDIDHFFTQECIAESLKEIDSCNPPDKAVFKRAWGILDSNGNIQDAYDIIKYYGLSEIRKQEQSIHPNTFLIKRGIFLDMLKGYDEKFCGKYGGDDTDLNNRYGQLHKENLVKRSKLLNANMFVFPDPARDIQGLFHKLRR